MGKIKKGLVREIKKDIKEREDQERLKEKYNIGNENLLIVEKNNILDTIIYAVKIFAVLLLIVLASIGVCTLLYSPLRVTFLEIFSELAKQVGLYKFF